MKFATEALRLAQDDREEAARLLRDLIKASREDYEGGRGGGMSGHESVRLEVLRKRIVDLGAVRRAEDCYVNGFGALVWTVEDSEQSASSGDVTIIYYDGHSDTVDPLPQQWRSKCGIDPWEGPPANFEGVNEHFLQTELEFIPPRSEWSHLLFGRGSADQLAGVVTQVLATRTLLRIPGVLKGVKVVSIATVSEEDNDGGTPLWILENEWRKSTGPPPPDCVVITEATGDTVKGSLGVYRGQRGRVQVELVVSGKSCHGSMPHLGLNPVEYGAQIVVEATQQAQSGCFARDPFLGAGTRTCSWGQIITPSDCAVPQQMILRFDRRLTLSETAEGAVSEIESLPAVKKARDAGLTVELRIPTYDAPSNSGARLHNPQKYHVWCTPDEHAGQLEGAFMQGVGLYALEELVWASDGHLRSRNVSTYKVPGADDTPLHWNIHLVHDDDSDQGKSPGVRGSKTVGEAGIQHAMSVHVALSRALRDPRIPFPATVPKLVESIAKLK